MMRSTTRRRFALSGMVAACALFTSVLSQHPASADSAPKAEVMVLHGTDCPAPKVDPSIGEVPPLKHNCWALLDRKTLQLNQGSGSTMVLANGRTFQIVYNGKTNDNPPRFKVATSISKTDGAGYNPLAEISAEPGKKFHVGGFVHQNGTLLLAIRITP
ncbi:MAG: hypothetical protein JST00_38375 [Deltaproteobacteria bacterium]|nr:hypothetical protein [Deltaproteobacteria bacterium]